MEKSSFLSRGDTEETQAIFITTEEAEEILGYAHDGSPDDDMAIEAAIEKAGYKIDSTGCGLATETGFYYPII